MAQAVDYSYARPGGARIHNAGYVGALRYLSYEPGKNISELEAADLVFNGVALGLVWETTANMMLRGAAGGAADSIIANQQADAVNFPQDRPIYYAVDFQPSPSQYQALDAYMRAVTGREGGVYGCYDVAEYFGVRGFRYIWQCAAWSGNGSGSGGSIQGRRVSQYSCLFQQVGYVLEPTTCDVNDILKDDWGQTPYGAPTPPPPTPPEEPVLDQDDKEFITNTIRDAVRPVVLDTGDGNKYLWDRGLPVRTGDVQIQYVTNLIGQPNVFNVNPEFVGQLRLGLESLAGSTSVDPAAIASIIVDQLGDDLAKSVADELATRLAN